MVKVMTPISIVHTLSMSSAMLSPHITLPSLNLRGEAIPHKLRTCIEYLQRICQFAYPNPQDGRKVECCTIYKFAIIILHEIKDTETFRYNCAERLTSVAVILSFNFVTDVWIASDDVTGLVCKCPLGWPDGVCRISRCKRECKRGCNCHLFESYIAPLKVAVLKDLQWNLFGLYKKRETEMHFIPCLPGRPFDDNLQGMHSLV